MKYETIFNKIFVILFRFHIVKKLWSKIFKAKNFKNVPWTPLKKPLPACKIALISTGGIILKIDRPFDLIHPSGDSSFRRIPHNVKPQDLIIYHKYYDHRDADRDPNLILPFEVLHELQKEGILGESNKFHYSFMGHIKEPHLSNLVNKSAVEVATELKYHKVDIALLVPA